MKNRSRLWVFAALIWLLSTAIDRFWWNQFAGLPSWDQADYLNSALDHARALGILHGSQWKGFQSLLDLSPKIPPLASLVNGSVMALAGDHPSEAAWSLSIWNGVLLCVVTAWGMRLSGPFLAGISVVLVAFAPALLDLRSDYLLEMPLTAVVTLAIMRLGSWWHPRTGGKWQQSLLAAFFCLVAVLVKQSALLVLAPAITWSGWVACKRNQSNRYQFLAGCGLFFVGLFPWLHHNWITTLGGTNRAVFESAAREGDPALWTLNNWLWYPVILPVQLGWVMICIGLGGLFLWFGFRKKAWQQTFKNSFCNDDSAEWRWLVLTLFFGWLLTTINPNKGDRYIAPLLPLLMLLLARGWLQWGLWIKAIAPFSSSRLLPPALVAGFLALLPASFSSHINRLSNRHEGPLEQIVLKAGGSNANSEHRTLIVVPSTPDLNQHNVSFYGRRKGGNLVGRQLGSSRSDIGYVLNYAEWVVLAEGDQGSVRESAISLDNAVRSSDYFEEVSRFPRVKGGSYSLWKRRQKGPTNSKTFAKEFPSLASGLSQGLQAFESLFQKVAVHHMLDGHFLYRQQVRHTALSLLKENPEDEEAHWTLALLAVLANRPAEANRYFAALESISQQNPWPSIYRCVVILADWNPWRALAVASQARNIHSNQILIGIEDLTGVLSGKIWKIPSAKKSLSKTIRLVEESLESSR